MTGSQFETLCLTARERQDKILFAKGLEYTQGSEDRGANFKRLAERLGVDPLTVWFIYFHKQVDGIASYVKFGKEYSEPIEGRFDDAMNYLVLGLSLIADKRGVV